MSIHELSMPELEIFLEEKIQESIRMGHEFANSKADFEDIEDKKKPLLAQLMSKHSGAQNSKEQKAFCDEDWKIYLDGLSVVRRKFYLAQVNYDNAKTKVDVVRTIISARKEEIKNFRG